MNVENFNTQQYSQQQAHTPTPLQVDNQHNNTMATNQNDLVQPIQNQPFTNTKSYSDGDIVKMIIEDEQIQQKLNSKIAVLQSRIQENNNTINSMINKLSSEPMSQNNPIIQKLLNYNTLRVEEIDEIRINLSKEIDKKVEELNTIIRENRYVIEDIIQ